MNQHQLLVLSFAAMLALTLLWTFGVGMVLLWARYAAKRETALAPRKPMFLCDKHGAIDERLTFDLTIPGESSTPLLKQKTCVMCYNEKMKAAEDKLKD